MYSFHKAGLKSEKIKENTNTKTKMKSLNSICVSWGNKT